jgi:hypothetical protein
MCVRGSWNTGCVRTVSDASVNDVGTSSVSAAAIYFHACSFRSHSCPVKPPSRASAASRSRANSEAELGKNAAVQRTAAHLGRLARRHRVRAAFEKARLLREADTGPSIEITLGAGLTHLSRHGKNRCVLLQESVGQIGCTSRPVIGCGGTISGTILGTEAFLQLTASRIL